MRSRDGYRPARNGEWHFNKDGSCVARPAQSFDASAGWTFLAVSFTHGGATDLYAWQAGAGSGGAMRAFALLTLFVAAPRRSRRADRRLRPR
ncbi:hypothetical protein [Solimonas soli]|uniref:hypothetical protein n=1 Tax=Solimonas soli TaxID=413479 RepID=UPI0004850012|nr:hypothetical protein [Solimonas soli]